MENSKNLSVSKERKYVTSIDGLRAISVIAVLAVHAGFPCSDAGWLGVDVFFAISGFLITTLLAIEFSEANPQASSKGKGPFKKLLHFWIRRALRLMPAYFLYISCVTIGIWSSPSSSLHTEGGFGPRIYVASLWLYFVNYLPMGGIWDFQRLSIHLWSLAVEEQFYLIWPIVFVCIAYWRFTPAILVASMLPFAVVVLFLNDDATNSSRLNGRGLGIYTGCVVGYSCYLVPWVRDFFEKSWVQITSGLLCLGTFLAITFAQSYLDVDENAIRRYTLPWISIVNAMFCASLWYCKEDTSLVSKILSAKTLVFLGRISYGIYLYHMLVHLVVWQVFPDLRLYFPNAVAYLIRFVVYVSGSIAMAFLSYRYIETPFQMKKKRFS